jgi:hypothetical protein
VPFGCPRLVFAFLDKLAVCNVAAEETAILIKTQRYLGREWTARALRDFPHKIAAVIIEA